jgi:hypothetical protein
MVRAAFEILPTKDQKAVPAAPLFVHVSPENVPLNVKPPSPDTMKEPPGPNMAGAQTVGGVQLPGFSEATPLVRTPVVIETEPAHAAIVAQLYGLVRPLTPDRVELDSESVSVELVNVHVPSLLLKTTVCAKAVIDKQTTTAAKTNLCTNLMIISGEIDFV